MAEVETLDIPVNSLGESYGRFHLVHPASEAKVLESLRAFGQILPVVTVKGVEPGRYELVDGFKRLRASRELGLETIQVRVLSVGERPAKAAILEVNLQLKEHYRAEDIHSALLHATAYHAYDGKTIERILKARAKPRTLELIRNERASSALKEALPLIRQRSLEDCCALISPGKETNHGPDDQPDQGIPKGPQACDHGKDS